MIKYIILSILMIFLVSCEENDATLGGYLPGDWKKVDTFASTTCGLRKDNKLYCWGVLPTSVSSQSVERIPQKIDGYWKDVSVGGRFICAISTENKMFCWGKTENGVIGDGIGPKSHGTYVAAPIIEVKGGFRDWKYISTDKNLACGIRGSNELYCWGNQKSQPVKIEPEDHSIIKWNKVWVRDLYSCATNINDELYCWGNNDYGQLGIGNKKYEQFPVKVDSSEKFKDLHLTTKIVFAISIKNEIFMWGGSESSDNKDTSPEKLDLDNSKWLSVSGGEAHYCLIKSDHTLYCFGINRNGELGIGRASEKEDLTKISGNNWKSISASNEYIEGYDVPLSLYKGYTCGIREENGLDRIYCWGNNDVGQLTGTSKGKTSPLTITEH